MIRSGFAFSTLAGALALLAAACGDDTSDPSGNGGTGNIDGAATVQDAGTPSPSGEPKTVPCPADLPAFGPGLTATSDNSLIMAKLVSADPTVPHKYENQWVVDFMDAQGNPVADIQVDSAETYMPVHQHNGGFPPESMVLTDPPGRVQFDAVNFTMPGPWEVRFQVSSAAVGTDRVVFNVCVVQ